jgi:O-methyltransferase domain
VVKRAFALRSRLRRVADAMLPPQGIAAERTFLLAEIKMLGVVCELQIPEAIDDGATTAGAIADRVGAQIDATERVLRFLASRGWFTRKRDGSYRLNARSRALRDDDPQSLGDWVRFMAADWHWDIWNQAIRPVRDGESAATAALGKPFFDWVHEDRPDAGATFDGAMRSLSSVAGPLVVEAVSLEGVASICDVGGGTGRLLRALLDAAPWTRGTVVDLAEVVSGAGEVLGALAAHRWSAVAGSFFEPGAIPDGHDRYVMQAIMHDWPDEQAGAILRNIRAAMATDSRLWVVDSILDPSEHDDMSKAVDMLMLTLTEGGRERTQSEWERLFSVNGFRIESQTQLPLLIWVFTLAPT